MAKRGSLRAFQETLVKRLAEAQVGDRRSLLGVEAGTEHWLVDLPFAGEILPVPNLTTVPLARPWFRGLVNVRGTLYSVIDFSAFHGGPPTPLGGHARILLAGVRLGVNVALLVHRASGLRNPDEFDPDRQNPTDPRPWVQQCLVDVHNHRWLRLDVARLLAHPAFLDAGIA